MRKLLKSYLFWTYPRGSFHYDVMVTLILIFIFLSPLVINYRERPKEIPGPSNEVLVRSEGGAAFLYELSADQIRNTPDDASLKSELLQRIERISGEMQIDRYSAQKDASGRVIGYRVWAHR